MYKNRKKLNKKPNIIRLVVITIVFQLLMFVGVPNPNIFSKESDNINVTNITNDPYTGDLMSKITPKTLDNGRAWVDKSVTKDKFTFEGNSKISSNEINVNSPGKEFLVALSALSQSYPVKQDVKIPVDVVFILDLSTSMRYRIDSNTFATTVEDTRAHYMVDALNKAIKIIVEANPEQNRVAVVAYSGVATGSGDNTKYYAEDAAATMLRLTNIQGEEPAGGYYFECTGSTVNNMAIRCNVSGPDLNNSRAVNGGTPTQVGIYKGAEILLANDHETTYDYTRSNGEPATVNRQPAMILLSDGEPTLGWTDDYDGTEIETTPPSPNGPTGDRDIGLGTPDNEINFGADFMTIVEAANGKKKVSEHYNGENARFYTIGLGVEGLPGSDAADNTPKKQARAVLNPSQYAEHLRYTPSGTPQTTYEMATLLDDFVEGGAGSATIPTGTTASSNQNPNPITVHNSTGITNWKYADSYYSVGDDGENGEGNEEKLNKAFEEIASFIVNPGNYTANWSSTQDPDYSGYLNVVDPIGTHMEFKGFEGFLYDGKLYTGEEFAKAIVTGVSSEYDFNSVHLRESLGLRLKIENPALWQSEITNLINSSKAGGTLYYTEQGVFGNSLKWYADSNLAYKGSYFDTDGGTNDPPDGAALIVETYLVLGDVKDKVANRTTSLMYMTLHAATAIDSVEANIKNNKVPLQKNDQVVVWEIPAGVLPLCKIAEVLDDEGNVIDIKPEYEDYTEENPNNQYINSTRAVYNIGVGSLPLYNTSYDLYSDKWSGETTDPENSTFAFFDPNTLNPYYYFIEDTDLYVKGENDVYTPATSADEGSDLYYRHEYVEETDGVVEAKEKFYLIDKTRTNISQKDDGGTLYLYVKAGERKAKAIDDITTSKTENGNENETGTYENVIKLSNEATTEAPALFAYLGNNGKITVEKLADTIHVKVIKEWKDSDNIYGYRPTEVSVQLLANGDPYGASITLNESNSWSYTWQDLPIEDNDGSINYSIAEEVVVGAKYMTSYAEPAWDENTKTSEITITNEISYGVLPEGMGLLKIEKTVEGDEEDKLEEFTFTIELIYPPENDYEFTYYHSSDDVAKVMRSGDEITLKHGENVIILAPEGTTYAITETQNSNYTVSAINDNGEIIAKTEITSTFTNTPTDNPDPEDPDPEDPDPEDPDPEDPGPDPNPEPEPEPEPDKDSSTSDDTDVPKTGDSSNNLILISAILGLVCASIGFLYPLNRKSKTKNIF